MDGAGAGACRMWATTAGCRSCMKGRTIWRRWKQCAKPLRTCGPPFTSTSSERGKEEGRERKGERGRESCSCCPSSGTLSFSPASARHEKRIAARGLLVQLCAFNACNLSVRSLGLRHAFKRAKISLNGEMPPVAQPSAGARRRQHLAELAWRSRRGAATVNLVNAYCRHFHSRSAPGPGHWPWPCFHSWQSDYYPCKAR
jgi:hypothetical protein